MKTYTADEMAVIIEKHGAWLRNKDSGERANLSNANLCYADLNHADLSNADLRHADLCFADLRNANLNHADLRYADLSNANLCYANLNHANLSFADLCFADLRHASLRHADLSNADLRQADLRFANLRFANLRHANLSHASGNASQLKTIHLETYSIAYTAEYLQIGCERHPIADWWAFDDARIAKMDSPTSNIFWAKWKTVLHQIIEMSPATPTGHETKAQEAAA